MRLSLFAVIIAFSLNSIAQDKDSLLKADINGVVELLEFMFDYDQTLREYTTFRTFDKSETNRIESLPDSLMRVEKQQRKFKSDTLSSFIWRNYINPMDSIHTRILIELTQKYGFPSTPRLKKFYSGQIADREFNPFLIFVHAPKHYWKQIEALITVEYNEGRINRCTYGWIKWHVNGRNDMRHFLENGYQFVEDSEGNRVLRGVDCN